MTPDQLANAACKGFPVDAFLPPFGQLPPQEAYDACRRCPAATAAACSDERGRDAGLRAGVFVDGYRWRDRRCVVCGVVFRARGGGYVRCRGCRG